MKTCIYFLFILTSISSCQNLSYRKEIEITNSIRNKIGLLPIDENLSLDSTFKFQGHSGILVMALKKYKPNENPSSFFVAEYYSGSPRNFYKRLYFRTSQGKTKVIEEEDRFTRKVNRMINCSLVLTYNYQNRNILYRIDSIPSEEFKRINQVKLDQSLDEARKLGMEICGTAGLEILEKGFPKRMAKITKEKYIQLVKEF